MHIIKENKNVECKIVLSDNPKPKFFSARKISLSEKDKVRIKLNEIEQGWIEKCTQLTHWDHPNFSQEAQKCMDARRLDKYQDVSKPVSIIWQAWTRQDK